MQSRKFKFTDEQRAAIVRDYLADLPIDKIAARYGCSNAYPSKLAQRLGHPVRPDRFVIDAESGWARARAVGLVIA